MNEAKISTAPLDWSEGKLEMIAEIVMGQSPDGTTYNNEGIGSPMLNGPTEFTRTHPIPVQYTTRPNKFSKKGDILFCVRGSSTGRMNLSDQPYCIGRGLAAIRAKSNSVTNFIYYILQNIADDILRKAKDMGSTFPNVNSAELNKRAISIPPISEQQIIADILSTVDEKIDVIEEQITQTQELKKGLMQRLLTKGIGHTTFKVSPIGEIPESWEVVKGEDIALKITKGSSPNWQGFSYQEEGALFVTSENVRDGNLNISSPKFLPLKFNEKQKNSSLKENDILINIVGASIGRACLFSGYSGIANINQAVCLMRLKAEVNPQFIVFYLQNKEVIKRLLDTQAGSARQNLSLATMRSFLFVNPNYQEQLEISKILQTVDEKLSVLQRKKVEFQELKKGLMQQLLTGKIRVNQTNPLYESTQPEHISLVAESKGRSR